MMRTPFRRSVTIAGYRRRMVRRSCSIHCAGFGVLVLVGVAGLSHEHGPLPDHAQAAQMQQLFALLLFAVVASRFLWGARWLSRAPRLLPAFRRRAAREVYLLMYLLVGSELLHAFATASTPHTERCLPYLGYVIAAQCLIRAMAATLHSPTRGGGTQPAAANRIDGIRPQ
jgi:cytochrome b561